MLNFQLDKQELAELHTVHRQAKNAREACRMNAVILLGDGWKAVEVANALLIDAESVRTYFKRYKKGGLDELLDGAAIAEKARASNGI